ncbi:MAG: acetyl-CoA carboxylase biotin carboxylase subunit, partial [Bryobacteraceae bacterium]
PGRILGYGEPSGPGVRVDAGVYPGWTVPLEYDPLLAKLSVWGENRTAAIQRMRRAVSEYRVLGIATNLPLFGKLMSDQRFVAGDLDTSFLSDFMRRVPPKPKDTEALIGAILAAANTSPLPAGRGSDAQPSREHWRRQARAGLLR